MLLSALVLVSIESEHTVCRSVSDFGQADEAAEGCDVTGSDCSRKNRLEYC